MATLSRVVTLSRGITAKSPTLLLPFLDSRKEVNKSSLRIKFSHPFKNRLKVLFCYNIKTHRISDQDQHFPWNEVTALKQV